MVASMEANSSECLYNVEDLKAPPWSCVSSFKRQMCTHTHEKALRSV